MVDVKSMNHQIYLTKVLIFEQNRNEFVHCFRFRKGLHNKFSISNFFTLSLEIFFLTEVLFVRVIKPKPHFHHKWSFFGIKCINFISEMTNVIDLNLFFKIFQVETLGVISGLFFINEWMRNDLRIIKLRVCAFFSQVTFSNCKRVGKWFLNVKKGTFYLGSLSFCA
jgi:hypothetical protein